MEQWLAKARVDFPDLSELIGGNQGGASELSPVDLWIGPFGELEKAYDVHPPNDDLIARIYDYAAWCFAQTETGDVDTDLSSATGVGLIESIPLSKPVSDDLFRWMSEETFKGCEELFRYHLAAREYETLSSEFLRKKKAYAGPSRL